MKLTRRALLGSAAGAAGLAGVGGRAVAQEGPAQIQRRLVIPAIDAFQGNYVGQFLLIEEPDDAGQQNVDMSTCPGVEWSEENTQVYSAQLLTGEEPNPFTVGVEAFGDGTKPQIASSTFFIVKGAGQCAGDYVSLECEWITRRSVVGKPPGPTVTQTEVGGQPGFGWLGGAAGLAGWLALRAWNRRS